MEYQETDGEICCCLMEYQISDGDICCCLMVYQRTDVGHLLLSDGVSEDRCGTIAVV